MLPRILIGVILVGGAIAWWQIDRLTTELAAANRATAAAQAAAVAAAAGQRATTAVTVATDAPPDVNSAAALDALIAARKGRK